MIGFARRPRDRVDAMTIRPFAVTDGPALVDLFNRAHATTVGHVTRSTDYWRWCITERPGFAAERVVVLADAARPVAYAVLDAPDVDASCRMLEAALDPDIDAARRDAVAELMVEALEARAREAGGEALAATLPDADAALQRALRRAGYREEHSGGFTATVVDVTAFVAALLEHRRARIPALAAPGFRLEVERGAGRVVERIATRVCLSPLAVRDAGIDALPDECVIATSLTTFNRLVFGAERFDDALAAERITVRPAERAGDARTLLGLVAIAAPWFTPLADAR